MQLFDELPSSKIRISGFRIKALAIAILCLLENLEMLVLLVSVLLTAECREVPLPSPTHQGSPQ